MSLFALLLTDTSKALSLLVFLYFRTLRIKIPRRGRGQDEGGEAVVAKPPHWGTI